MEAENFYSENDKLDFCNHLESFFFWKNANFQIFTSKLEQTPPFIRRDEIIPYWHKTDIRHTIKSLKLVGISQKQCAKEDGYFGIRSFYMFVK